MHKSLCQDTQVPVIAIETAEIKRRSVIGVASLISRSFVVSIIALVSQFALTVFLDPATYGIYYLVGSVVNFLTYFSDIGLAGALIQKKEEVTREDLITTFTIQQLLVAFLLLLLFIFSPNIKLFFNINSAGIYLMWAMGISLLLTSFKTIPSVLLERQIQFDKLIIPIIAETIVFNGVAVYLAWKGWGINTFTVAVLARGVVGLVAMYIVSPWRPALGISRKSLSHLMKFGLPYQVNTFLAVIKDDGMTIFLGKVIGQTGLGYIGWASRWANQPLRIFMDNVTKVAFPAFARLQHDQVKLTRAIELSIKYLTLIVFPIFIAMAFLALPVVSLIPKYSKWLPAIVPLHFYLFNAAWASISTMMTNALNAIGKITFTFKLMLMWTGLTWVLMPILALEFGYLGVSYAVGLIALSSVVVILVLKKIIPFSVIRSLKTPLLSSLILSLCLFLLAPLATSLTKLIVISVSGVAVYILSLLLIEGKSFIKDSFHYFRPSHA